MFLTMAGVILFQVPISWLADRCGRMPILLGCYAVLAATLIAVPLCSSAWLAAMLFLMGGCSGVLYPLGMSLLGERLPDSALPRAYAWYLAIDCIGSQLGAPIMGQARDWWGEGSMFAAGFAAVLLVLASAAVIQRLRVSKPPKEPAIDARRAA
jgi:MFS family permease